MGGELSLTSPLHYAYELGSATVHSFTVEKNEDEVWLPGSTEN